MTHLLLPFLFVLGANFQPLVIPGERLAYEVSSARFGRMGTAVFGVTTLENGNVRLSFDFEAKVFLFKASDHTASVLDGSELRTLYYTKDERSPVGKRHEEVAISHATSTWTDNGKTQPLASAEALDELSFIYLVRSIRLEPGEEIVMKRHFDHVRNPVKLRAIADATYDVVEMSVPDKRQKNGFSTLRFYLTRDDRRAPARIESIMPVAGRVTMTLIR